MFDQFFPRSAAEKGSFHWVPASKRKTDPHKAQAKKSRSLVFAYVIATASTFALWFLFYGADWINHIYRQSHLDAYRAKFGHEPYSWDMLPDRLVPDLSNWAHIYACIILLLAGQAIIALMTRHR
jgi:hypothetical protein